MPLSWNEIKTRATAFSNEWKDEVSEDAEAKSFWDDFFNIFGINRRRVASFEQQVKKIDDKAGYIDLLWKGVILIEHKSRGKDLDKAYQQAKDYFPGLKEKELPRYILVSDFERFRLYDLEENTQHDFTLPQLVNHVNLFGFIAGYQKRSYKEQDPANIEAALLMGKLHDKLKAIGYTGHQLELYLVRLLFCLFADDTSIFEKGILTDYIEQKTNEDGSDLARAIAELFQVLNTPEDKRFTNLDESLAAFPYVNGKLFEENLSLASFDSTMRDILLDCSLLDWGKISPAIFGSLFQSVMDEKARRNLGAHYTSEKNILKLIKPLFLDELWAEYEKIKTNPAQLKKLHEKISRLRFLDPACGCGNFLIIAYRELRLLEIEIVKGIIKNQAVTSINDYFLVDVDQFYGIEYEEFPAQIAQVAMWLIDHQMNMQASTIFGEYYTRLPLRKSATIVHGNALRVDWQSLLIKESTISIHAETANLILNEPEAVYKTVNVYAKDINFIKAGDVLTDTTEKFDYIFGNPPFIGHQWRNKQQMQDMDFVFADAKRAGRLDYVAAWYIIAAKYIQDKKTKAAFVSTSSISQGEQVSILWNELYNKYKIKIHFAHRSFKWSNEAKGNAGVHVVIIGFANFDAPEKRIFEYNDIKGEPHEIIAKNINPYLTEGKDLFIENRGKPIHNFPEMFKGSQPTDGGHLILTQEEKDELTAKEPNSENWIKPFVGGEELINGGKRFCLWLKNISPNELKNLKEVFIRVEKVKESRLKSPTASVREFSKFPTLFTQDRQPASSYLAIPEVSSENRVYIPIGFLDANIICSNKLQIIPKASLYMFGILESIMHMTWTKYVCGRLESRVSYSPSVYNNFPWPESPIDKQKQAVETAAQLVLDARADFQHPPLGGTGASLADLYDPNTMPPALVKAHQQLDRAVDNCYRSQPFINETKRIEFLFELYDKYTAGLFVKEKKVKKSPKKN